jgi:hypothetical protein
LDYASQRRKEDGGEGEDEGETEILLEGEGDTVMSGM